MTFEKFIKMVGTKPAKIEANADEKCDAIISLVGRGFELLGLSMQIAESVMEKTHTGVDDYCNMLKRGIKNDFQVRDSKKSKEEPKSITKEQFKDAWMEVLKDIVKDNDLDGAGTLAVSVVTTKYTDTLCKKLFGEGLTNENSRD